ncbi:MAG: S9 family peptidase [Weeksellaceae bacterium]|jgi:dipeptidyl-peptidase-4|nr:S9 family peptidase [Weeksellaceae bacterium]
MKRTLFLLSIVSSLIVSAQQITLENIWGGKYYAQGLWGINSMNDGQHYSLQERDGIYKYSYESLLNQKESRELIAEGAYDDYSFSSDEKFILLATESEPIYRHSFLAKWEVYNTSSKTKQAIFNGKKIQEPIFSPDASKVAFVYQNNMYYQDLISSKITQLTHDGKKNEIINGLCDWVYEEEFGFVRHFDWNSDGSAIAFVRSDETDVREFFIPIYQNQLYPEEIRFKYPKAGEVNSKVSLHVYDLNSDKTSMIDLSAVQNYYIFKVKFTQNKNTLAVLTSNRHQNQVDVSFVDIKNAKVNKLFTETDDKWIETDDITLEFLSDNSFLWTSERDGNRHIYYYSNSGKLINQVTKGDWEVTNFYGYNPKDKTVYFQSNAYNGKRISTEKFIQKINLDGKKLTLLTDRHGNNSAQFSKSFDYFINPFSSISQVSTYYLKSGKENKELAIIRENETIANRLKTDGIGTKELTTFRVNGTELNAWIIKPKDFNPNKKYPVLMYQYSGPGSQQVLNTGHSMNDQWYFMLAQKGYLVICVDGRGTGGKGVDFKKQTYLDLGKLEVEDQINAAKEIGKLPYVDASRIGIWGWSYGGYMSSNCIFRAGDVFKMAIAVAPVTNWRYYDTVYTERFMRTPQENPEGYDKNSPITYAANFDDKNNKFLLIHGTADDNVHVQNAMDLADALIMANKQFDMMIYPDKNHGIYGGATRLQLYTLMTNYILNNL